MDRNACKLERGDIILEEISYRNLLPRSLGKKKGAFVTLKLAKKDGRAHYAVPSYTFPGY